MAEPRTLREVSTAGAALLAGALLLWKLRILDFADSPYEMLTLDLWAEHHPMAAYGFGALSSGRLPLWNPHQLLGLPFLAIPHTALFYPLHLPYLVFSTAVATEIVLLEHFLLAGLGMWWLARALGFGVLPAGAAALTHLWAGSLFLNVNQATPFAGICWLAPTLLCVEKVLRGSRVGPFALLLAIAFQVLNGATEVLLYNLYAAALYALFGLGEMVWQGAWRRAASRGLLLLACVSGGVALSAPQLLPSLELVSQSARVERISLIEAIYFGQGIVPPVDLLEGILSFRFGLNVGLLPVLGIGLGFGYRRFRRPWSFGLALAALAALLVSGGPLYRLYHLTPMGGMFRIPLKFLPLYSFGLSLLAGVATARLCDAWKSNTARRELWTSPGWIAGLLAPGAGLLWLWQRGAGNAALAAGLAALALFGLARRRTVRAAALALLLMLQALTLFPAEGQTARRPSGAPELYAAWGEILEKLRDAAGLDRIFVASEFLGLPGLTPKQGMLTGSYFSTDYEALAMDRYGRFFIRASVPVRPAGRFAGMYDLQTDSRWRLMDLTSTRFYVFRRRSLVDLELSRRLRDFGFLPFHRTNDLAVYSRPGALPRAYFVPSARVLADEAAVLEALDAPDFDPRREILLDEAGAAADALPAAATAATGTVRIARYDPELVVLEVEAEGPGFAVLTDFHYPGWRAWVAGRPAPVLRANYLMRAVAVGPGRTRVTFAYRPESFRLGCLIGAASAAAAAAAALVAWRRARRTTGAEAGA